MSRSPHDPPAFAMCSIVAKNYLPTACLLAESFRRHHPDVPVTVLVVDGTPDDALGGFPFEVVLPSSLPIDRAHLGQMSTYYDVTELSTALKPFLLEWLLGEGADAAMYLDPDIEVFRPLNDLFALALEHAIALTPHVTQPVPRDGLLPSEESFLRCGQFNLGFVCVSAAAVPFLGYWSERTRMFALRDVEAGYFTDQRWVDAVPTLFEHVVVRDTSCNVAYWNLHERDLDLDRDGCWTIDGRPLSFFHYSGHDANDPYRLSVYLEGRSRVRVDLHPPLRRLLRERSVAILSRAPASRSPRYGLDRTRTGFPLDLVTRRMYRDAVRAAEERGTTPPPHAFADDGGAAFVGWCTAPAGPETTVPRSLLAKWHSRADLQAQLPDPLGRDGAGLVTWALDSCNLEASAAEGVLDAVASAGHPAPLPGVNLVGYLNGEFGVGAAGRSVARMLRATGLPVATTVVSPAEHRHLDSVPVSLAGTPFEVSVLAMNADGLIELASRPDWAVHAARRRVGVWYWEVGEFPAHLHPAYDLVDEVWCASEHVRAALSEFADRPVVKHPVVIDVPGPTALTRGDVGLPDDRFLFGFAFDYRSVTARKNPVGLIEAYRGAFGPDDGATLVVKSIHARAHSDTSAEVRAAAEERPDIVFLDDHLEPRVMRAFFELLDCYVSLHRSEGLGLTIASAMASGTPAIATGWSGNLEFMTQQNSVLLPFDLVEVGPGADPYPATSTWAQPRPDAASAAMRRLFDDPAAAKRLGRVARADLRDRHAAARAADWCEARCNSLTGSKVFV